MNGVKSFVVANYYNENFGNDMCDNLLLPASIFQTVYDQWFITLFNIVYTSLPVLAMGLFDQVQFYLICIMSQKEAV